LPRIVQLLDAGADVNGLDQGQLSPLAWALAMKQREEMITLLLGTSEISTFDQTPEIFWAKFFRKITLLNQF
jgi:ankyrin repeat protein